MTERDANSYVRRQTCEARHEGNNREIKDMKSDIQKLDSRIWWIVGSAVMTFVMSAATLYMMTQT